MKHVLARIYQFLKSTRFFKLVLLFFILEAAWIAFSAAYPQAFDENFHFGLIQVYSHYWLPFLSKQPANANAYGAVARDPSYLYHYLMSFPYQFIALFIHQQIGQVIVLRFINIALFGSGIILSRRVLLRVGISTALANTSLLLFTLIPIVPQLAAQINYDNLLIPLTAWVILIAFNVIDGIRARKPSAKQLIGLGSLCLLTALVKYAFFPIFAGIIIFLTVVAFKAYRHRLKQLWADLWHSWKQEARYTKVALLSLLVISVGMFAQRDIVNVIAYHSIEPNCSSILSIKQCSAYSPWYYNYTQHGIVVGNASHTTFVNPIIYIGNWLYWMWYRLFFAVNGPNQGFTNYPPLPLPAAAAIILAIGGAIATVKWRHKIFKGNIRLILLLVVCSFYTVALLVQGYSSYRYTDILENMNGRYLLPILLFVAAIVGRALSIQLRKSSSKRIVFSVIMLLLFLQGGGIFTFIDRSDQTWDVSNSTVVKANNIARHITNPVIIDGKTQYTTSRWFFN